MSRSISLGGRPRPRPGWPVPAYIADWLRLHVPAGADSQVRRVAHRFAVAAAAGELAIARGILPWPQHEAERAAVACFRAWLRCRGGIGQSEVQEALARFARFIGEHGGTRFSVARRGAKEVEEVRSGTRAAYRRCSADGETEDFLMLPATIHELRGATDADALVEALDARGWLARDKQGRACVGVHIPGLGESVRCYRILPSILGDAEPGDA